MHHESNNTYVFSGFGLGLIISDAIRVLHDKLLEAYERLNDIVGGAYYVAHEILHGSILYGGRCMEYWSCCIYSFVWKSPFLGSTRV
nr:CDPK-related kinase 5 [Tanacetum cinerariifolium]